MNHTSLLTRNKTVNQCCFCHRHWHGVQHPGSHGGRRTGVVSHLPVENRVSGGMFVGNAKICPCRLGLLMTNMYADLKFFTIYTHTK